VVKQISFFGPNEKFPVRLGAGVLDDFVSFPEDGWHKIGFGKKQLEFACFAKELYMFEFCGMMLSNFTFGE
jgi:hypothetical protein